MKNLIRPKAPAQKTLTRRSLLDWLGKATVLSLGGNFLAGCVEDEIDGMDDGATPVPGTGPGVCENVGPDSFVPGDGQHHVYDDFTVYTVDPQNLEQILDTWTLKVDGLVENPIELSFVELLELPRQDQVTDFHCVVGWSVYDVPWNGIHLSTLFDIVKPLESATYVTFHTLGDVYNESLTFEEAVEPKTMLGYGIACATLPLAHGFPARLVIPSKLGYKNAKYVYRIELDDKFVPGYWEQQGYPADGNVSPDRLRPGKY